MAKPRLEDYPNAQAIAQVQCKLPTREKILREGEEDGGEMHRIMLDKKGRLVLLDHTKADLDVWRGMRDNLQSDGVNILDDWPRCRCDEVRWLWRFYTQGGEALGQKRDHRRQWGRDNLPTWLLYDLLKWSEEEKKWYHAVLTDKWMERSLPSELLTGMSAAKMGRIKHGKRELNRPLWMHAPNSDDWDPNTSQCYGKSLKPEGRFFSPNASYRRIIYAIKQVEFELAISPDDKNLERRMSHWRNRIGERSRYLFYKRLITYLALTDAQGYKVRPWSVTGSDRLKQIAKEYRSSWMHNVAGQPWAGAQGYGLLDKLMIIDAPPTPEKWTKQLPFFPVKILVDRYAYRTEHPAISERSFDITWGFVFKTSGDEWRITEDVPWEC